ncbi:hypothetical protein COCON_G00218980 [Conger conger]|uniref:Acyl-coenzyme A diphosphatase NUDT19 n=1 Tax=Conger conger TaxID=82655 RepID=A0A9Q1CYC7_CONCO|nr:hypothetical protein COCON_G00218980 [Conger conger]
MNSALKHWKEAATVILAARTGCNVRPAVIDGLKTSEISSPPNFAKSDLPHNPVFDYEVLLLQRSSKAGFMPKAYVFPGGLVESSDFSSDWLETFKSFRHWPNFGLGLVKQAPETRPPIFATDRQKLGSPIPSAVALRICAVRETFEESGILLVVPKNEENDIDFMNHRGCGNNSTSLTRLNELFDKREVARWRALEVPHTAQDEQEIVHFKWSTPSEVLHSFQARELFIPMPQVYELGRMCHYPQLQELHSFARMRAAEGCEQFVPVRLESPDCRLALLPGDDLYPKNLDQLEERGVILSTEKSFEQLQRESAALHRAVFSDLYTVAVHMNITPKYKHLRPIGAPSQTRSPRPKL